jgi:L-threonylcarbamoyladenylate synthase
VTNVTDVIDSVRTQVLLAAEKLAAGEVIGLPTETVYGLAADAANPSAVREIFTIKNRPSTHPLITHIAADADIGYWIDAARMSEEMWRLTRALMAAFFPGPLTLVLPKHPQIDATVTGGQDTIAFRSPNHVLFQDVLAQLAVLKNTPNVGIAAPSANRFGRVSPTRAVHVREEFEHAVWVLDGDASVIGIESTIVGLTSGVPRILRFGHITPQDIERVTGITPILPENASDAPRVSGSLLAHYAPSTPMMWLDELAPEDWANGAGLVYSERSEGLGRVMRLPANPHEYARGLYHALRQLDTWGVARIAVERLPDDAAWDAVRDRLNRAIVGSNLPSSADSSNKGIS